MNRRIIGALCALALGAGLPGAGSRAHGPGRDAAHERSGEVAATRPAAGVRLSLPDARLTDQDGREVRLRSGVLEGRVTVVNFVYTTCTTVCPVLSASMAQLQRRLGERLGSQVRLVSITVDPQRDTPARLKAFAAKHEAGEHWHWLTGRKSEIDGVLKAFGTFTPNPEDHPSVTMIGDAEARRWTRLYGFPGADDVLVQVEQALSLRIAGQRR